jgi:hypothetical protein
MKSQRLPKAEAMVRSWLLRNLTTQACIFSLAAFWQPEEISDAIPEFEAGLKRHRMMWRDSAIWLTFYSERQA